MYTRANEDNGVGTKYRGISQQGLARQIECILGVPLVISVGP